MGGGALRFLKAAVAVMTVLIVLGVATLAVLVVRGISGASGRVASITIDEPSGTRVVEASLAGDRIVLRLEGGGPDRVIILDLKSGRVISRVGLIR